MESFKQLLGTKGEKLALQFLRRKGYKILVKNFACRTGEIDIIARDGEDTVFIEVKTRSSDAFGLPQASVCPKKRKHIFRTAQFYIKNYIGVEENFRFDVVSIVLGDTIKIELIKNAF